MKRKLLQSSVVFVLFACITESSVAQTKVLHEKMSRENVAARSSNQQILTIPNSVFYCATLNSITCSATSEFISNVSITGTSFDNNTICDSSNAANNYSLFAPDTNTTANLTRNTSYNFNVTTSFDAITSIWIDYNADGAFDTSEWTQVCLTSVIGAVNTIPITIPGTAVVGPVGMRVRTRESSFANGNTDACTDFFSGETEDYTIGIEFNVGIGEHMQNGVSVYTSQAGGLLNFIFSDYHSKTNVNMYDVLGKKVTGKEFSNSYSGVIDVSSLKNGMYLVSMENSHGTFTKKIILNR